MVAKFKRSANKSSFRPPRHRSKLSFWGKVWVFCFTHPKTTVTLLAASLIIGFIITSTIKYIHKKGFMVNDIKLSRMLTEEGMTSETVRMILKQRIETYITNFSLMRGNRFQLGDEMFSNVDQEESLTFNTPIGSINFLRPGEYLGELIGGNDQELIDITITDDEISYECYLRIKGSTIWSCKMLKADYINKQYALKDLLLKLSKRILEISHPLLMGEYYCNTNQIDEGLKLVSSLMNDKMYKINTRDTSLIFAYYMRLDHFETVKTAVEKWVLSNPDDVLAYRLLMFDAIKNDLPDKVIREKVSALRKFAKSDPYLITNEGQYYIKRKMYDSAFICFSNAAKPENETKYSPQHYWEIQKQCAFTAFLSSKPKLADSFFNECAKSKWVYDDLWSFRDTTFTEYIKEDNTPESSAFGNFILGIKKYKFNPKDKNALYYFNLSHKSARDNWIVKLCLSDCYRNAHNYPTADSLLREILAVSPNNYLMLVQQAILCIDRKNYLNAYLYAKQSLQNRYMNYYALRTVIYACMQLENYDQAVDYCYEMLNYFPKEGFVNETVGDLFMQINLGHKAIYHYKLALENYKSFNPKAVLVVSHKVSNYYRDQRRKYYDDTKLDRMIAGLSDLLKKTTDAGMTALDEVMTKPKVNREDVDKYEQLSVDAYNRGDIEISLGYSKNALALDSLSIMGNFLQGLARIKLNQPERAEAYMVRGVRLVKQWTDINKKINTLQNILDNIKNIFPNGNEKSSSLRNIIVLLETTIKEQQDKRLQD